MRKDEWFSPIYQEEISNSLSYVNDAAFSHESIFISELKIFTSWRYYKFDKYWTKEKDTLSGFQISFLSQSKFKLLGFYQYSMRRKPNT